jgi:A/G-specific adenine glycosylase
VPDFARKIALWQQRHGRHALPWQNTRDPYRIWVSEIMLQQTQVEAAIPYYQRFLSRFPDVETLARASPGQVLEIWAGLGYYARARNLHMAAREIVARGSFPDSSEALADLPGIGRSTAGAIAAFAFGRRAAILDGNVKRLLSRCFALSHEKSLWEKAEKLLPDNDIESYTQGLMDLGATVCTRLNPQCNRCPVAKDCVALREDRIAELPAVRKKKPLPLRRATWLVLLHQGSVLLERRPPTGIWGGLWTFPESDSKTPGVFCRETLGCEVGKMKRMPTVEHGFTHFKLQVRPVHYAVKKTLPRAESPGRIWLDLADAARAAVPAPVKKLLLGLSGRT